MAVSNLNKYRKRKKRADDKQRADENAIRHGRSKAERARDVAERKRHLETVEGAKRTDAPDGGE